MGVINKTNILIEDRLSVIILDKFPDVTQPKKPEKPKITNPSKPVSNWLFPTKQKLDAARPNTKQRQVEKKKGLFKR
jgi:hypothetical protein